MSKHQQYYQAMIDQNLSLFSQFQDIHDKYVLDSKKWQTEYNEVGSRVVEIVREWERKLCSESEKGKFGKFSNNLADKFWELVRQDYPRIDFVGANAI